MFAIALAGGNKKDVTHHTEEPISIIENLGKLSDHLGLPINSASHGLMIDSMIGWTHWLMLLLFIGWGIYPLGYLIGTADGQWYSFMAGLVDTDARDLIYNVGDAVNKIGFGLVVWCAAKGSKKK